MPKTKAKKDVYQIITDRLVEQLEKGTAPWQRGWKRLSGHKPMNYKSKKAYRGINTMILSCAGYSNPHWVTYKQAVEAGGKVKKGEKGCPVIYWNWLFVDADGKRLPTSKGAAKKIPLLRYYTVFNADQTEGINWPELPSMELTDHEKIEKCQEVIDGYPNPPTMEERGDQPCYVPLLDTVRMPQMGQFDKREEYYSTTFHELVHSTGHKSRLGRLEKQKSHKFGSDCYSKEELVAEMGAAFLCGECQIEDETLDNSASYLKSWISTLKGDSKLAVMAAAQAQKAVDHILDYKPEQKEENDS